MLDSFLIEITSMILPTKDKMGDGFLVDKILDKTGMKGTGMPSALRMITLQEHNPVTPWLKGQHRAFLHRRPPQMPAQPGDP